MNRRTLNTWDSPSASSVRYPPASPGAGVSLYPGGRPPNTSITPMAAAAARKTIEGANCTVVNPDSLGSNHNSFSSNSSQQHRVLANPPAAPTHAIKPGGKYMAKYEPHITPLSPMSVTGSVTVGPASIPPPAPNLRTHNGFSTCGKRSQVVLGTLTAIFLAFSIVLISLFLKDSENYNIQIKLVDHVRHDYVELKRYPLEGMYLVLVSAVLDTVLFFAYVFGCFCHQQGCFKFYMHMAFLDFVFIITGSLVLFLTQYKIITRLDTDFKVILDIQYGFNVSDDGVGDAFVDKIQREGQCCGYMNYTDWTVSRHWVELKRHIIPPACCTQPVKIKDLLGCSLSTIFPRGCKELVYRVGAKWRIISMNAGLAKFPLLMLAMVFCAYLHRECIRRKKSATAHKALFATGASGSESMLSDNNGAVVPLHIGNNRLHGASPDCFDDAAATENLICGDTARGQVKLDVNGRLRTGTTVQGNGPHRTAMNCNNVSGSNNSHGNGKPCNNNISNNVAYNSISKPGTSGYGAQHKETSLQNKLH